MLPSDTIECSKHLIIKLVFSVFLFSAVSVHSVVEVLLHFLQALPDSVVPIDKYAKALHVADDAEQSRALISSLPRVNRFVFYYITAFVNKCLEPSNANRNLLDRMTAGI